jgi:hypothetical protein
MKSTLITGGRVLDPLGELHRPPVLDILVEEGKISAVGELARLRAGTSEIMDASGLLITPGFVAWIPRQSHLHRSDGSVMAAIEQRRQTACLQRDRKGRASRHGSGKSCGVGPTDDIDRRKQTMRRGRTAARGDSGRTRPQDEPGQEFDDCLQSHVIGGRDRTSGHQSTVSALFLLALNLGK